MGFLPTRTDDEHARITADYMPNGPHLVAKRLLTRNMYKLIKGLSKEFSRLEETTSAAMDGMDVRTSSTFLEEWETTAGIPDVSFDARGTVAERQKQCFAKLSAEGVSTAAQFEWLASLFGLHVTVWPGHYFYLNLDPRVGFFSSEKESRFTVVFEVNFDLSDPEYLPTLFPIRFPWVFGSSNYGTMKKFFDELIPANCNSIWIASSLRYIYNIASATDIIENVGTATDVIEDI